MKLSFLRAKQLGIGILLGIILAYALVSVLALQSTTTALGLYHADLHMKKDGFTNVAFLNAMFLAEFNRRHGGGGFAVSEPMLEYANNISEAIDELGRLALSEDEQRSVESLRDEERKLRTIVYTHQASFGDPCAENLPQLHEQIDQLVQLSVNRALAKSNEAGASLDGHAAGMTESAERTTRLLAIGAACILAAGLMVGVFLTRALGNHIAGILRGTRQLAEGNLDYRIRSSHTDAMGQLADQIDRMADRIQDARASTETILANLPVGVTLIGPDRKIRYVNGAAMEMLRVDSEADLIGRDCHGVICETGCCSVLDPDEAVLGFEAEALRPDGSRISILKSVTPLEVNGEALLMESFIDITERKRAEAVRRESEVRFETLFENAGDGIAIVDLEGEFLAANRVMCDRLGYSRDELMEMSAGDISAPEAAAMLPERIAKLREMGSVVYESTHVHKDGHTIAVEISARQLDFSGRPAAMCIVRDITERKRAEEES